MPRSFAPLEPAHAAILILGTMPSVKSLEKAQYYGHPQNRFWPMLFALWNKELPQEYEKRTAFLLEKHIALWDVLQSCDREGSLDAAIRNPVPNPVWELAQRHPELHTVFFNSKNAQIFFDRLIRFRMPPGLCYHTLPSSSPARAMRAESKLAQWQIVRQALERERE